MTKKYLLATALFLAPVIASAQYLTQTSSFIGDVGGIVQELTVVAAGIALLVFFWGIVKFIRAAGNEEAVKEGKRLMVWGVIALFVMVSVWGLVQFLQEEFGVPNATTQQSGININGAINVSI